MYDFTMARTYAEFRTFISFIKANDLPEAGVLITKKLYDTLYGHIQFDKASLATLDGFKLVVEKKNCEHCNGTGVVD